MFGRHIRAIQKRQDKSGFKGSVRVRGMLARWVVL